jgi:hypothetical protein
MYSQRRYEDEEDIDRLQEEAERNNLNNSREYNGRDDREYNGRDDREYNGRDDREYNGRDDREYNGREYNDGYGYNAPASHAPASYHAPASHHAPAFITSTIPRPTSDKKYRASTYDKHDKAFSKQMQHFELPPEFNKFTDDLLKETDISRLCLLQAIDDYNKMNFPPLPAAFQKAAEHCRRFRRAAYTVSDKTYAKQMSFYDLPQEFNDFTDDLIKETHINRIELLQAIENYNEMNLPRLPSLFQDMASNCQPDQACVIC